MVRAFHFSSSSGWHSLWNSSLTTNRLLLSSPSLFNYRSIKPCMAHVSLLGSSTLHNSDGKFWCGQFFLKNPVGTVLGPLPGGYLCFTWELFPRLFLTFLGGWGGVTIHQFPATAVLSSVHRKCSLLLPHGADHILLPDISFRAHLNCCKFSPGILSQKDVLISVLQPVH